MTANEIQKQKRQALYKALGKYMEQNQGFVLYVYFGKSPQYQLELRIVNNDLKGFLNSKDKNNIQNIDYEQISLKLKSDEEIKNMDFNRETILRSIQSGAGTDLNPLCGGYFGVLRNPERATHRYNSYMEFFFNTQQIDSFIDQHNLTIAIDYISINELTQIFSPITTEGENTTNDVGMPSTEVPEDIDTQVKIQIQSSSERNIIFFGSPGTGKSYQIGEQAKNIQVKPENVIRTTFHPEYSYYDFVGQYKPVVGYENVSHKVTDFYQKNIKNNEGYTKPFVYYDFVPGSFTKLIVKALKTEANQSERNTLLVIEEINRGNCAAIFGDIFQLLDRCENVNDPNYGESQYHLDIPQEMQAFIQKSLSWDDTAWQKRFPNGFVIPSNVFIYATMNTSDQSLFPMDAAFKRRWSMNYVPIDYQAFSIKDLKLPPPYQDIRWLDFIKVINAKIVDFTQSDDKQLGQWFVNNDLSIGKFVGKVLSYLWFDVFRQSPEAVFENKIKTYDDIVSNYDKGVIKAEIIESIPSKS